MIHLKKDIDSLEKIQRRAARFVNNDFKYSSSPTQMMASLGWVPLAERRAKAKVKTVYKANNNILHIPICHFIKNKSSTRKSRDCFTVPRSNTDVHLYSFYPDAIRLWNKLPLETKESPSLESFTKQLEKVTLRTNTTKY